MAVGQWNVCVGACLLVCVDLERERKHLCNKRLLFGTKHIPFFPSALDSTKRNKHYFFSTKAFRVK